MSAETEKQVERLGCILARLSSPFDGERAAAALLASRQISLLGISWQDLARRALLTDRLEAEIERARAAWTAEQERAERERAKRAADAAAEQQAWRYDRKARRELIEWLLSCAPLTDWERGFVSSLAGWGQLTEKQSARLEEVVRTYVDGN